MIYFLQAVLFVVITLVVALMAISYYYRDIQNKFLYMNECPPDSRNYVDLPRDGSFETLSIVTSDGCKLDAYLVRHTESDDVTPNASATPSLLVYFHGNAGNIWHRAPMARLFARHLRCHVLMVDYRGYGGSSGSPTEEGLKLDALATLQVALQIARSELPPPHRVYIMGTSLGGAVAIDLCSRELVLKSAVVHGVIVENTFTRISDMVNEMYHRMFCHPRPPSALVTFLVLRVLKPLLLWIDWASHHSIQKITTPILFLSSQDDEIVPSWHMHALYGLAKKSRSKEFVALKAAHNDPWTKEGYFDAISKFMTSVEGQHTHREVI